MDFVFDLRQIAAILDLPTLQCLRYFMTTLFLSGIPDNPMADT